jgi:hypothetical protein
MVIMAAVQVGAALHGDQGDNMGMHKISPSLSGALRTFAYWVANGSVGYPLLTGIDYRQVLISEPGLMERLFAIYANRIELDADNTVLNAKAAEHRAAQWLRQYVDADYTAQPVFEDWEIALH